MYPNISYLLNDLFGINIPLPIQTFGFFVAIAFLLSSWTLSIELKRKEDEGDDLWKVFNVIQEKITQGDFHAALTGAKVRKVRKIASFEKDLKVNKELFKLATALI